MKEPKRYITFKIETAENLNIDKIILLTNPINKDFLDKLLYKLQQELGNYEEE
jgi:hypothetical protein